MAHLFRCNGCEKNLLAARFSETMKRRYLDSLAKHQQNPKIEIKYPRCVNCSGGNVQELKCIMCDTTKSLDHFNKNQRQKPDEAHCKDCSQEKVDREPNHADEVQEVEIIQEMDNQELGSYSSHFSSAMSSRRSRLSRSRDPYENDTNPGSDIYDGNEEVSLPDTTAHAWSDISSDVSSPMGTGWNIRSGHVNHPRSLSGQSSGTIRSGNAGFAKQHAPPRDKYKKADEVRQRNERIRLQKEEQAGIAESDSDDDDGEAPY